MYKSISQDLLNKALDFASIYDKITAKERNIIIQAKNSLLTNKQQQWQKKSSSTFDVTMGSFETCELVGGFLLSQLQTKFGNKIGLYRDDGLAVTDTTPRMTENIKKEICPIFKEHGLQITIEANKLVINFLDVTLNLRRKHIVPTQNLAITCCTYTAKAITHHQSQETYPQELTDASHPYHQTRTPSTSPHQHTRKPSTRVDTIIS